MREDSNDSVEVHPLLVDGLEVLIMPEVTRVLRMVFQVLSQPNYYLSKSGISSRRLSGPHLMKLKILGIVNNDVKVCSYITKDEAMDIFKSFSSVNTNHYLSKIIWTKAIDIENATVDYVKTVQIQPTIKPELTYFIHEGKSMVPWMGFLKILSCENIESEKLTDEFVETLQNSASFKVIEDQSLYNYLSKIKKIHHFGNDLKYVSMEEIMDVLIKLGISVTSLPVLNEINKIRLLPPIYLDKSVTEKEDNKMVSLRNGFDSSEVTTSTSNLLLSSENVESLTQKIQIHSSPQQHQKPDQTISKSTDSTTNISKTSNSNTVFVYEVNDTLVVALPDIHKIIRKAQNLVAANSGAKSAQQRQVNYYLTKMRCKKGRFTFMQLKTIRKIGTPLGNATYCTYISKEDAINLFKIYSSLNMENPIVFQSIVFSEPISLGIENIMDINGVAEYMTPDDPPLRFDPPLEPGSLLSKRNHVKKVDTSVHETDSIDYGYGSDRELFRKYENAKGKLRRLEKHMAIITKYYKWKMRHITKTNRYLKTKWEYLCRMLDSMEDSSIELANSENQNIFPQNGNIMD